VLSRSGVLNLIGLTPSRLARWQSRSGACRLEDVTSCPRSSPAQLTAREVHEIRTFVHDPRYAHVPVSRLAWLAARTGRVCSPRLQLASAGPRGRLAHSQAQAYTAKQ
jgi:hypothetical protein